MLNEFDLQIVHALQEAPRASWAVIAAVLGTDTRTVARSYERLRARGEIVVTQTVGPRLLAQTKWALLRARALPGHARLAAEQLAAWPQATTVRTLDGSFQIYALLNGEDQGALWEEAQDRIATIPQITQADIYSVLTLLDAGRAGRLNVLSNTQVQQLRASRAHAHRVSGEPTVLTAEDLELFTLLSRDGRAQIAACAAQLGRTRSWVSRRVSRLQADGLLDIIAITPDIVSSRPVSALIWGAIAPAELQTLGSRIASLNWVGLLAVTTGESNILLVAHLSHSAGLPDLIREITEAVPSFAVHETQLSTRAVKIHTRMTNGSERWSGEAEQPYVAD